MRRTKNGVSRELLKILGFWIVAVFLLAAAPATRNLWDSTYESNPTNTDDISQSDDWKRKMKEEVRRRMQTEHSIGSGLGPTSVDNGLHREGSARCFMQAAAPTALSDSAADWDVTDGVGETLLTATGSNSDTRTLGEGRCWIDTDDGNTLYFHDGTAWIRASGAPAGLASSPNLLLNGSFDIYQDPTSTNTPNEWGLSNATVTHQATTATEGPGHELTITATAANGGVQQTIRKLKASTTYYAVARYEADAGNVDDCELDVATTGGTDLTALGSSTSYSTLSGLFVTDATPTNPVLRVGAVANTEICTFDHLGVYEVSGFGVPTRGFTGTQDIDPGQVSDDDTSTVWTPGNPSTGTLDFESDIVYVTAQCPLLVNAGISFVSSAGTGNKGAQCELELSTNEQATWSGLSVYLDFIFDGQNYQSKSLSYYDVPTGGQDNFSYRLTCSATNRGSASGGTTDFEDAFINIVPVCAQ